MNVLFLGAQFKKNNAFKKYFKDVTGIVTDVIDQTNLKFSWT